MKLRVIVAAWERPIALRIMVDCFLLQTCQDWEMIVMHDGPASVKIHEVARLYREDSRVRFFFTEERKERWGHPLRHQALSNLSPSREEFVLLTNDDNYYVPYFVEYMLRECRGKSDVGMVYCDTVHSYMGYDVLHTQLRSCRVDMGSFITRLDIAYANGFNHVSSEIADGIFAEECSRLCAQQGLKTIHVKKPLFVHN